MTKYLLCTLFWLQSYLDHFSESLRQEYSDQGITIQLLKPYFIADGTVENIIPGGNILAPTPEKYARGAVATLGWSENTTGYWIHTLQVMQINHSLSTIYHGKLGKRLLLSRHYFRRESTPG